jgi:hypothetical protein
MSAKVHCGTLPLEALESIDLPDTLDVQQRVLQAQKFVFASHCVYWGNDAGEKRSGSVLKGKRGARAVLEASLPTSAGCKHRQCQGRYATNVPG